MTQLPVCFIFHTMSHSRQKKRTFSSQTTGRDYAVNLYEFIVKDGQYNVYAMDYKDAWATLFENEPKVKTTDIMFMMETKCATKNETLH